MTKRAVIYRTGGTENFKWNLVSELYADLVEATESAVKLRKMGFPDFSLPVESLADVVLPTTYYLE